MANRSHNRTGFAVAGGLNDCDDQAVTEWIFTEGEGETAEVIGSEAYFGAILSVDNGPIAEHADVKECGIDLL